MAQERENLKTDEENRLVTRGVLDENYVLQLNIYSNLIEDFSGKKKSR